MLRPEFVITSLDTPKSMTKTAPATLLALLGAFVFVPRPVLGTPAVMGAGTLALLAFFAERKRDRDASEYLWWLALALESIGIIAALASSEPILPKVLRVEAAIVAVLLPVFLARSLNFVSPIEIGSTMSATRALWIVMVLGVTPFSLLVVGADQLGSSGGAAVALSRPAGLSLIFACFSCFAFLVSSLHGRLQGSRTYGRYAAAALGFATLLTWIIGAMVKIPAVFTTLTVVATTTCLVGVAVSSRVRVASFQSGAKIKE
jgi:hypothetical protein